jgi:ABC-2 type transport system permease protein
VSGLVAAELLKLRTTRLLLWIAVPVLAFLALSVIAQLGSFGDAELRQLDNQRGLVQPAGIAIVFAVILGIAMTAGEYAHGTITHAFLAVPRRERVVAAKVLSGMLAGLLLAVFAGAVTLAIVVPWLSSKGISLSLGNRDVYMVFVGVLVGSALGAGLGVGLGGVLRRQSAAVVLTLTWLLIGEHLISVFSSVAPYAPGHAFASLVAARTSASEVVLEMWHGGAVAAAYALALAVAGGLAVVRRDVG